MKTFSINPFVWIKSILIYSKFGTWPRLVKYFTTGMAGNKHNEKNIEYPASSTEIKPGINEFRRKAHSGNFFAGPHCVFDPRLL